MLDGNKIREPDENSGPALLGREPVVLPDERKEAANRVKDRLDEFRS